MNIYLLVIVSLLLVATPVFSACDDYAEDIAGWTYTQDRPEVGNTSLTLSSTGTLKVNTSNGFGLWIHYAPFTPISIVGATKFSFKIRGKNTNIGWQNPVPSVTFVDGTGNNITFEPYYNTLSTDGITWNTYEVLVDFKFRPAGSLFNPANKIAKITIFTDTWDVGYSLELDAITFAGDSTCNFAVKGCRLLGISNVNTWSHVQELAHGSTSISLAKNVVTINTTTGWGLWTTFTHPFTTGGDRFSFQIKAYNPNVNGWQANLPKVTFTDDLQYNAVYTSTTQQLLKDGVTWKKFNLLLNTTNVGFSSAIDSKFNRYSVKKITFFFDTWDATFNIWLQNLFFDTKYVQCSL